MERMRGAGVVLGLFGLFAAGCTGAPSGEDSAPTPTGGTGTTSETCETIPDRTCGYGASSTGDTGCPEGYACSGPSAYVCYRGDCELPSCLPPGTTIDTPSGPVPLRELEPGDLVWTLAADRQTPVPVPILRIASKRAPARHQVASLALSDGRHVRASPGHPTADGTPLGDLRPGDWLDGARIESAALVGYGEPRTWDLLPAGPTGAYWADGVLLGSTL